MYSTVVKRFEAKLYWAYIKPKVFKHCISSMEVETECSCGSNDVAQHRGLRGQLVHGRANWDQIRHDHISGISQNHT